MPGLESRCLRALSAVSLLVGGTLLAGAGCNAQTKPGPKPAVNSRHAISHVGKPDVARGAGSRSALSAAKTIQLKEALIVPGQDGLLHPVFMADVTIERPGRIKADATPLSGGPPQSGGHILYSFDGVTEHEFLGDGPQYTTFAVPNGAKSRSQVRGVMEIDLILAGGQPPAPEKGVKRLVTSRVVDGRAMILISDVHPAQQAADGRYVTFTDQYWNDAKTHLPYRHAEIATVGNKTVTLNQVDFSEWKLNQPVPADRLAWSPPAGVPEHVIPNLLKVGVEAPDFALTAPDGAVVHLSDYKGKTVIVDFWATWCRPCQVSLPHLDKVYRTVKDQGVAVLAVCVWDTKPAYDAWVAAKREKFSFPTVFDPAPKDDINSAGTWYGVSGIPTQYVVDKNGKIAAVIEGYSTREPELEQALAALGVRISTPKKTASIK